MIREIKISPVLNGFLVTVGCQTLVFESSKSLVFELKQYLDNHELVEREYRDRALNRWLLKDVIAPERNPVLAAKPTESESWNRPDGPYGIPAPGPGVPPGMTLVSSGTTSDCDCAAAPR